jgi:hypothetical protein
MISKLRDSKHKELLQSMEQLINAYIELAFLDVSDKKKEAKFGILPTSLRNNHNLKLLAVPTINMPVDPSCTYKVLISIMRIIN